MPGPRLLSLLLLVLASLVPLRLGQVWSGVSASLLVRPATAGGAATPSVPEAPAPATPSTAVAPPAAAAEELDPLALSAGEVALLRQLAARRAALEAREQALGERESLLAATEQRLKEQLAALGQRKSELATLGRQQASADEAGIKRLVAVYETMKPEEAARLFEHLDGEVLLAVAERMAERKLAPVLAQMAPERAGQLSLQLARRRGLPGTGRPS